MNNTFAQSLTRMELSAVVLHCIMHGYADSAYVYTRILARYSMLVYWPTALRNAYRSAFCNNRQVTW